MGAAPLVTNRHLVHAMVEKAKHPAKHKSVAKDDAATKEKQPDVTEENEADKDEQPEPEIQARPCKHLIPDSEWEELRAELNKKRRVDFMTEDERDARLERYFTRLPIPENTGPFPTEPYPVIPCLPIEWSAIDVQDDAQVSTYSYAVHSHTHCFVATRVRSLSRRKLCSRR